MYIRDDLPGAELLRDGLRDLANGVQSVPALLVAIGAPRLRRSGIKVPDGPPNPEHRLYARLAEDAPNAAHGRYHALIRRLVSLERALECAR